MIRNLSLTVFTLILQFLILSCEDSPQETTVRTKLISVNLIPGLASGFDRWTIIHDEDGDLLEFKEFKTDEPFEIETLKPVTGNSIIVTVLFHISSSNGHSFNITSYSDVEIGKAITLGSALPSTETIGTITGTFTYTLNDYNPFHSADLGNKFGGGANGYTDYPSLKKIEFTGRTRKNVDKYIFHISDADGNLKYKILSDITPGGNYSNTLSELDSFDEIVEFTFPEGEIFTTVRGKEHGQISGDAGFYYIDM